MRGICLLVIYIIMIYIILELNRYYVYLQAYLMYWDLLDCFHIVISI